MQVQFPFVYENPIVLYIYIVNIQIYRHKYICICVCKLISSKYNIFFHKFSQFKGKVFRLILLSIILTYLKYLQNIYYLRNMIHHHCISSICLSDCTCLLQFSFPFLSPFLTHSDSVPLSRQHVICTCILLSLSFSAHENEICSNMQFCFFCY